MSIPIAVLSIYKLLNCKQLNSCYTNDNKIKKSYINKKIYINMYTMRSLRIISIANIVNITCQ